MVKKGQYGALIAANSKLIIIDQKGTLSIIDATEKAYKNIAQCKLSTKSKRAKWWTIPVLHKKKLFCRNSKGDILCIEL